MSGSLCLHCSYTLAVFVFGIVSFFGIFKYNTLPGLQATISLSTNEIWTLLITLNLRSLPWRGISHGFQINFLILSSSSNDHAYIVVRVVSSAWLPIIHLSMIWLKPKIKQKREHNIFRNYSHRSSQGNISHSPNGRQN